MVEPAPPPPRYEPRDISVRAVIWFAVGLIFSAIIIHFAMVWLYEGFEHRYPSADAPSRIAFGAKMIAPEPRLQINPPADLERFQAEEEAKLNSYGWIDRKAGVARIPIHRAMDLIAQRGLPVRGPGTQNSSGKTAIDMQREKAAATKP